MTAVIATLNQHIDRENTCTQSAQRTSAFWYSECCRLLVYRNDAASAAIGERDLAAGERDLAVSERDEGRWAASVAESNERRAQQRLVDLRGQPTKLLPKRMLEPKEWHEQIKRRRCI